MEGQFVFYASVILPIKWEGEVFYGVTAGQETLRTGSWVSVVFGKRTLQGVVRRCAAWNELPYESRSLEIKPLAEVLERPAVSAGEIRFWDIIARYYLCSAGEVFKAAYPILTVRQQEVSSHRKPEDILGSVEDGLDEVALSEAQQKAMDQILEHLLQTHQEVSYPLL